MKEQTEKDQTKYVYGLQGLAELLKCSHPTAHTIKKDKLEGTYMQSGKTIVFDVALVRERLGIVARQG
ncbi:MAG: DUF3853 family protein [Paludibacter sp.]|nr:DUF3853 family protein [Paludibacter sp.]